MNKFDQYPPEMQAQMQSMYDIVKIMEQQALLRGQMEGLASVLEILIPEMGAMPASAGLVSTVSLCATEWARPMLADLFMTIGGLEEDIKAVEVKKLGTILALKGFELSQAHSVVCEELDRRMAELEVRLP